MLYLFLKGLFNGTLNYQLKLYLSFKDLDEDWLKYLWGENKKMICEEIDETIQELFKSLLTNYKEALENNMTSINFVFDYVDGLSYSCQKKIKAY